MTGEQNCTGDKKPEVFAQRHEHDRDDQAFGNETNDWVGERVELYAGEAPYQDKMVPSVRVTPLLRAAGEEKKPKKPKPKGENGKRGDLDDEIPF